MTLINRLGFNLNPLVYQHFHSTNFYFQANFRRGSDVTETAPSKTRVRVDEHGNITTENLTWAEAQRLVEVEDDSSNKIYRVSIYDVRSSF